MSQPAPPRPGDPRARRLVRREIVGILCVLVGFVIVLSCTLLLGGLLAGGLLVGIVIMAVGAPLMVTKVDVTEPQQR
jgi:hypothetical protein